LKARYVLILGGDELQRGQAALRDMEGKSQEDIPLDSLLTVLRQKLFQD
jgi:histidyl-tRNA synthetase